MALETCPNCGADVPPRARACPECGACEETGWSEEAASSSLGIPEEGFNYKEFVQREFGPKKALPHGVKWYWSGVSVVIIGVLLWLVFR